MRDKVNWDILIFSTPLGSLLVRFPKEVILLAASPSSKPVCLPVHIVLDFSQYHCLIFFQIIHGESLVGKKIEHLIVGDRWVTSGFNGFQWFNYDSVLS